MSPKQIIDSMVNHVLHFLLLAYHGGQERLLLVVHLLDLLMESFGVVSFGPRNILPKGIAHDVLVVEEVLLLTLVGSAHLIEFPDILVFDLFDDCEVCSFSGGILEVYVIEIAEIDIHFADCSQ